MIIINLFRADGKMLIIHLLRKRLGFMAVAALLLTMVVSAPPAAQDQAAAAPTSSGEDGTGDIASDRSEELHPRAAVTLDGEVLFLVRGITAFPAEQRAATIRARIKKIAADRSIDVKSLRLEEAPDRTKLLAGDRFIMGVFDADAELEGIPRQLIGEVIIKGIATAITAYRHDRSPRVLLVHTLRALAITLGLVLFLFVLRRAVHWLNGFIERRLQTMVEGLEAQAHRLIHAAQVWKAVRGLINGLQLATALAAVYLCLEMVLSLYPWTRQLARRLLAILLDPLAAMGAASLAALPNLVFLAVLIFVMRALLKIIRLFFAGIEQGGIRLASFDRDWALPIYRIVRILLVAFVVVVAYPYIPGSNSEAFKGVSIFLGLLVSLGSTSFIANLVAGYAVIFRRAFKVGDRIRIGAIMGDVTRMGINVTQLRTIKNEMISVPNSLIMNSEVINYTTLAHPMGLILHTTVGIGYETPWRQVEAMLLLAAGRTPGLLREPAPFVFQKLLGDFCITYELNVYCDNAQAMGELYSRIHRNILDVFNEYGVQIMTPAYESDPPAPKVVPREMWFQSPAELQLPPAADINPRKP